MKQELLLPLNFRIVQVLAILTFNKAMNNTYTYKYTAIHSAVHYIGELRA